MTELLTASQMRDIEQAAIESGDVTGLELMERAGAGVVEAIFEHWPEYQSAPQSVAVLCGPGNNGGDGFVVARLLAAKGWTVKVFLYGDPANLPPDARVNYEIWITDNTVEELTERGLRKQPYTLYIDALFGTGLTRPLEGAARQVISLLAGRDGDDYSDAIVSIDAPSGLCLDSGVVLQAPPVDVGMPALENSDQQDRGYAPFQEKFAALTVAFDSPKVGHFIAAGPACCGRVAVKDIGLENWRCFKPHTDGKPRFVVTTNGPVGVLRPAKVRLTGQAPIVRDLRNKTSLGWSTDVWLDKRSGAHKFSHGHALVLSGGHGKTGAARLAARGALRIGAGLVTLASPRSAMYENAAHLTAIMLHQIDGAHGVSELLEDKRISALCLGPGLGRGMDTQAFVIAALKEMRPTVLDADALTRFERDPQVLFDLLHDRCVLTPHGGEFSKLFPDLAEKLAAPATTGPAFSKVEATCEAAVRAGCVVLYKGADTVIATPDGRCSINAAQYERAAPWLATAGSGDVLAGFITGLLARGLSPLQAAETGAWLHVEGALQFGPGLIAEDLPEQLPAVFRRLEV
jgi:ADP-dependent NAD(P)H-hydrate dehydratase / NAD(P)H-hydrate epimerase